ncbi:MAG: GAF:ATP-binding region, ATPase-like:Histidine kinase, region:Histidine kinase, dimerization [Deltaproteobacteria bacterium]|nr:GAF:ATP-binding region, ATPase-like:Histidine kinase, region:Histidine kinase, dimerization [Deltaproteobacteria bacterium]
MKQVRKGLIFKLGGILLLILFTKLLMIGIGIYSARHLQGDVAAINYAGSERMRIYKLSFLINKLLEEDGEKLEILRYQIEKELNRFEIIVKNLREGEANDRGHRYEEPRITVKLIEIHPVFQRILGFSGVYEPDLRRQIEIVSDKWFTEVRPLINEILKEQDPEIVRQMQKALDAKLPSYADSIDRFVAFLEDSTNRKVMLFYSTQYLFLVLTIAITLVWFYLVFFVIKRSVQGLMEGIRAMTSGDFSKRVAVISDDETGELARGFNFMADKLEESHGNLEKKVMEKTTALEERNRELSILYETAASLNQSLPLDDILHVFLKKLLGHLNVGSGSVRLVDEDGSLRLAASIGLPDEFKRINISLGECLCGTPAKNGTSDFWDVPPRPEGMILKECLELGYRTVAVIPVRYKERLLGVTNLFVEEKREFTSQEKRLLESLSSHIGVAIEYYNLNAKAKRLAIMEERNILAHELHDSIAQSLAYLNIQTSLLEGSLKNSSKDETMNHVRQIREGIRKGYGDVRELLNHFRTQMEEAGLDDALKSHLNKFSLDTGIESSLESGNGVVSLSPETEIHVFHIIQEALANVRKHSGASRVRVSLSENWPLQATVADDGIGFDLEKKDGQGIHHMGLSIMRERASKLGGSLNIYSGHGKGTRVVLNITKQP